MPILLSKQNYKRQYYSDRPGFMETLFKSMTDLLFSDFSDENPGTKERFLDFLGDCEFSRDVLAQVERSVSKGLIGYFSGDLTASLSPASQKALQTLTEIVTREKDTEDTKDHKDFGPDRSCESAQSQMREQLRQGEPIIIDRELLAYLTLCEGNKKKD